MEMLFSELKCKDVINLRDCRCIGRITDLEFHPDTGCICKVLIPKCKKTFNLFAKEEFIEICFRDIRQIGPDIILVDLPC